MPDNVTQKTPTQIKRFWLKPSRVGGAALVASIAIIGAHGAEGGQVFVLSVGPEADVSRPAIVRPKIDLDDIQPDREPQTPLSLRWETKEHWRTLDAEFGGGETAAAMILALATAKGEWVSYSRRMQHYSIPRRYKSRLYTYSGIIRAADHLERSGLILHDRAPPGRLGWQSAMAATPELIARTEEILKVGPPLKLVMPRESIILRDAGGAPIDYRDTGTTRAMRKRTAAINEALVSVEIAGCNVAPMVRIFNINLNRGGRFYAQG